MAALLSDLRRLTIMTIIIIIMMMTRTRTTMTIIIITVDLSRIRIDGQMGFRVLLQKRSTVDVFVAVRVATTIL